MKSGLEARLTIRGQDCASCCFLPGLSAPLTRVRTESDSESWHRAVQSLYIISLPGTTASVDVHQPLGTFGRFRRLMRINRES